VSRSSIAYGIALILSGCALFAQQSTPVHPAAKSPKLCVAGVGNGSLQPIQVNEVKDELVKKLVVAGLNPDPTGSATLVAKKLELSGNNQESVHLRRCDFMLLTAIDSAKPGAKGSAATESGTPAVDHASEGALLLSYALFQTKVAKPLVDTSVDAPAADTPTHAVLQVLDKEVEQVRHLITKK
jgi:hypothetical protein